MDPETRKELDNISRHLVRIEARNLALQWAIGEHLRLNEEHQEALNATLQNHYERMMKVLIAKTYEAKPQLAARLYPEKKDVI